jgi:hypothetical protein|tara:strand:- start:2226 stop:2333 length:108 start_codon:yes stop_codon:yes gene_type:complete
MTAGDKMLVSLIGIGVGYGLLLVAVWVKAWWTHGR